jgi:hypothetical protein
MQRTRKELFNSIEDKQSEAARLRRMLAYSLKIREIVGRDLKMGEKIEFVGNYQGVQNAHLKRFGKRKALGKENAMELLKLAEAVEGPKSPFKTR